MIPFKKSYIYGIVDAYDGEAYTLLLPNAGITVVHQERIHRNCVFPEDLMTDGHLKVGVTLELCSVMEGDHHSLHPYYKRYQDSMMSQQAIPVKDCLHVLAVKKMLSQRRSRHPYLVLTDALDILLGPSLGNRGPLSISYGHPGWLSLSYRGPMRNADYACFLESPVMDKFLNNTWKLSGRICHSNCIYHFLYAAETDSKWIQAQPSDSQESSIELEYRIDSAVSAYSRRYIIHIVESYALDYPGIQFQPRLGS